MAKAKKKMPPKVSQEKREEMYQAFCERQNCDYVATKCDVSWHTAAKWRDRDGWDERFRKVIEKANKKVDNEAAQLRAEGIAIGGLLIGKGAEFIKSNGIIQDGVAVQAVGLGWKIRREALGEPSEITQQKVIIELVDGSTDASNGSSDTTTSEA
jgi:hypothetical protein